MWISLGKVRSVCVCVCVCVCVWRREKKKEKVLFPSGCIYEAEGNDIQDYPRIRKGWIELQQHGKPNETKFDKTAVVCLVWSGRGISQCLHSALRPCRQHIIIIKKPWEGHKFGSPSIFIFFFFTSEVSPRVAFQRFVMILNNAVNKQYHGCLRVWSTFKIQTEWAGNMVHNWLILIV